MSILKGFEQSSGYLRIGEISSLSPEAFRCTVIFPGTYSMSKDIPLTPSPLIGFMPKVGSRVVVFSKPGHGSRVLFPLESDDGRSAAEVLKQESKSGTIPLMEPGDVYIGHHARAYFSNNGDVRISSKAGKAYLDLDSEKSKADLYGYNFELSTPGKNVRICSKSTIDVGPLMTWGDSLHLEVNVPLASLAPGVIPSTLGRIVIDRVGSVDIDVLPITVASNLSMDITGAISIGRGIPIKTIGVDIGPVGLDKLKAFTPTNYMLLDSVANNVLLVNIAAQTLLDMRGNGDIKLGTLASCFKRDALIGFVSLETPTVHVNLSDAGDIDIGGLIGNIAIDKSGDITAVGKIVDISATASASIKASSSVLIDSPAINLGLIAGGHVAFAEKLVLILQELNALHIAIQNHSHSIHGIVTTGPGSGGVVLGGLGAVGTAGTGGTSKPDTLSVPGAIPSVPTTAAIGSSTVTAQV